MKLSEDLLLDPLRKDIHVALKKWHTVEGSGNQPLAKLLLVQEIYRQQGETTSTSWRLAINKVLLTGIDKLRNRDSQAASILEKRFQDKETILHVSQQLKVTHDRVKHKQREALKLLAAIVQKMEVEARKSFILRQEQRLEAKSYSQLFGVDAESSSLLKYLTTPASPWVITLVGIGGIGKTSLANYAVRRAIYNLHYAEVIWVKITSPTQRPFLIVGPEQTFQHIMSQLCKRLLPALPSEMPFDDRRLELQKLLKSQTYLIIVDNLEWKADTSFLLAELMRMTNPSRFLLTSRTAPAAHVGALSLSLKELDMANSLALIRHYSQEIGFYQAAEASDEALVPIFEVVGGNPYALKQLVNLAKIRPLPTLLSALRERPLTNGKEIYHHILRETWITLSQASKSILTIMTLAAEGGMNPEQIMELSGLSEAQLWPAIDELIGRSLLEVRNSDNWSRFYGIHRLTELFVRSLIDDDDDGY